MEKYSLHEEIREWKLILYKLKPVAEQATPSCTTDAREKKINLSMTLAVINPIQLIMHTGYKWQLRRGRTLSEKYYMHFLSPFLLRAHAQYHFPFESSSSQEHLVASEPLRINDVKTEVCHDQA